MRPGAVGKPSAGIISWTTGLASGQHLIVPDEPELPLAGGGSTAVSRRGDAVLRARRPWSTAVVALLQHLNHAGFMSAPVPIGTGFAGDGREQLRYIDGEPAPACWSEDGAHAVGYLLRQVHTLAADFSADSDWMPWWGRALPSGDVVIGHCDAAPWNFLARGGLPHALLDWDTAGPVGREWDVAQTAWLNCQLHDDDVAGLQGLPDAEGRVQRLVAFCDGYCLTPTNRSVLVGRMIEVALRTSAQEAIDAGVTPEGIRPAAMSLLGGGTPFSGHGLLWAVTWRVRSARWMSEHRPLLEEAVRAG